MPTFSTGRAAAVLAIVAALLCGMVGRVAYLQTYGRERTIRSAERQQHQIEILPARRGTIFDSTGVLMAGTIQTKVLFVDPKFMQDCYLAEGRSLVEMDDAIVKLARALDMKSKDLMTKLVDRGTSRYLKIAENLDEETCAAIAKMNLPGVGFQPMSVRTYPMGSLAAHVLGGTGKDKDGRTLEGLELYFDALLGGHDGWKRTLKDARRNAIAVAADDYCPPEHGQHLILTIDANIQMFTEQELADACVKKKAKRGEAVVMDPQTGEVLALANWPTFNPQNHEDSPLETRANKAIVYPYEPGSTIKPFVAGPALAWHITHIDEIFRLGGKHYRTPYGRTITDVHGYDQLALWDVLVKSSNIGMSMLGERMGNPKLHQALTGFGFGRPTGIELPGEGAGKVNPLRQWSKYSTESVSQGYELMVTPLQLCRAFCCYANGGRLLRPRLIKGVLDSEGNIRANYAAGRGRRDASTPEGLAVDPATAADVKRILCDVVLRGTAAGNPECRSTPWNIFGKTGTAHITEGHGYSETKYNSSFMGGAPAENPRVVVAFILHEPDKSTGYYGGTVSAPPAVRLIARSLAYLQVPPSPDLPLPPAKVQTVLHDFHANIYQRRPAAASAQE